MVPLGFKQCLIRRHERCLAATTPISPQTGAAVEALWNREIFDVLLPGQPKLIMNLKSEKEPTWSELNAFVRRTGVDTVSGLKMAPHYEHKATRGRLRIIIYGRMQGDVNHLYLFLGLHPCRLPAQSRSPFNQWHIMWEHVVGKLRRPQSAKGIEFTALHNAWDERGGIPKPWNDW